MLITASVLFKGLTVVLLLIAVVENYLNVVLCLLSVHLTFP